MAKKKKPDADIGLRRHAVGGCDGLRRSKSAAAGFQTVVIFRFAGSYIVFLPVSYD